jgi:hypothetical protein
MKNSYSAVSLQNSLIMTPDSPFFYPILQSNPPPGWRSSIASEHSGVFVCDSQTGMLRTASEGELDEYLEGGEYDEAVAEDDCFIIS